MAEAADTALGKLTPPGSDVSARLQQALAALLFPSNLAAKAALFAVVVALLPLLPTSQAPARIWDLPHLLLLGIIISYGVFGQKNADAEVTDASKSSDETPPSVEDYVSEMMQGSFAFVQDDGDEEEGGNKDGGVQAWSSRYLPDNPLVVVADPVGSTDGKGDASDMPLHLPVRKLKPADQVPAAARDIDSDNGIIKEEEFTGEFVAPKTGYGVVRERAIPSPSSVLDADLTLSPSSPPLLPPPPPPPPFLDGGRRRLQKAKARSFNEFGGGDRSGRRSSGLLRSADSKQQQFRSKSAVHATRSAFAGYDPPAPAGYEEAAGGDGEWDDETVAGAASDSSSLGSDEMLLTDNDDDREENSYGEDDDDGSCDEELFELATRAGPEAEADEVDRKAEEFIAKFRDQIRMQRVGPAAPRR